MHLFITHPLFACFAVHEAFTAFHTHSKITIRRVGPPSCCTTYCILACPHNNVQLPKIHCDRVSCYPLCRHRSYICAKCLVPACPELSWVDFVSHSFTSDIPTRRPDLFFFPTASTTGSSMLVPMSITPETYFS